MRVFVLGSTGMLGHMLVNVLKDNKLEVIPLSRLDLDAGLDHGTILEDINNLALTEYDYVINCIGIVPQRESQKHLMTKINSDFPQILQQGCAVTKTRLIHISTNCVFNGAKGEYSELDIPNAEDDYGRSKLVGEKIHGMIIRTSFVGPEIKLNKVGLLEWLRQAYYEYGYINYYWNGVTTLELSNLILKIIKNNLYNPVKMHIHSPHIISKYELLSIINKELFKESKIIVPYLMISPENKTLTSFHNFKTTKTIYQQIKELKGYMDAHKNIYGSLQ